MSKVAAVFTPEGQLAKAIEGFQPRDAQLTMAQAIEKSIRKKGTLVVEAETGTGKTFAYLAPVLQAKGKAIISTYQSTTGTALSSRFAHFTGRWRRKGHRFIKRAFKLSVHPSS